MNERRHRPATRNQRYQLDKLGIGHPQDISESEASELLGRHQMATDDQRYMLEFFGIAPAPGLSRYTAMRQLRTLLSVPANKARWEARICSPEQREILHFFKLPVRAELKYKDADRLIEILFSNRRYTLRWDRYETVKFARQAWFEKNHDYVNDLAAFYGCSPLNQRSFKAVVTALEARGMTLQEIENDYAAIFREALMQWPQLQRIRQAL